jgi:hypothetical protein
MAQTYTVYLNTIQVGNGKALFAMQNIAGSSKIIRIYRIGLANVRLSGVSGVIANFSLRTVTGTISGGTDLTLLKNDPNNDTMPGATGILTKTNCTHSASSIYLRRIAWSTDEPSSASTKDEIQSMIPLNIIWY